MNIHFSKYQGTGNDFVIIDNRKSQYNDLNKVQVKFLCDRRFGVGGDGLMLLNLAEGYDFEMRYYNSDGGESTMCGNGGRCLVKFAYHLGIHKELYHFIAIDGPHNAEIDFDGTVSLQMKDVKGIKQYHGDALVDTGSPHYVKMTGKVQDLDVFKLGKAIRNSSPFEKEGINVNFVEQRKDDEIFVRTYERGVENETFSCGTGVTASALVFYHNENGFNDVTVRTPGGKLSVEFVRNPDESYSDIWLCGPAEKVFEGDIDI